MKIFIYQQIFLPIKFIFARAFQVVPLIIAVSCAQNLAQYGKVTPYGSVSGGSQNFVFKVDEAFVKNNASSRSDEENPVMTMAEADLLEQILIRQKQCLNSQNKPSFKITSKQEKIYDITFASLIEQNYNAKPVAPRMYYGRCAVEK